MSSFFEYKGYLGSKEMDTNDGFAYGRLMFIRDVVSYRSDEIRGLKAAFEAAVDDYLTTCAELEEAPDVPCKGTFNVRIGAVLHQRVVINSTREDVTLNEWIKQACELKLAAESSPEAKASASVATTRTFVSATFEEEQVFDTGRREDWQTLNSNHMH